jgi:RNA polymerase sigma-70 factor (ECF subfamily)
MSQPDMSALVDEFYRPLYLFALSLARNETAAQDLTQETFCRWAQRGHQLREDSKARGWLFTTLYREFLRVRQRSLRWPQEEFVAEVHQLVMDAPDSDSAPASRAEAGEVMLALQSLDETHRVPLTLFYLNQMSYREISELLEIPAGTVMSRLSRGKAQLRRLLEDPPAASEKVVPFRASS